MNHETLIFGSSKERFRIVNNFQYAIDLIESRRLKKDHISYHAKHGFLQTKKQAIYEILISYITKVAFVATVLFLVTFTETDFTPKKNQSFIIWHETDLGCEFQPWWLLQWYTWSLFYTCFFLGIYEMVSSVLQYGVFHQSLSAFAKVIPVHQEIPIGPAAYSELGVLKMKTVQDHLERANRVAADIILQLNERNAVLLESLEAACRIKQSLERRVSKKDFAIDQELTIGPDVRDRLHNV